MATVRLNRPDAMNSLDIATKDALVSSPAGGRGGPDGAMRGADRQRAGVLRGPGPARAHHLPAERRPIAVGHGRQALQPHRRAARDDEQAGHRRRSTAWPPGRVRVSHWPRTSGCSWTRLASTSRSPGSRCPATPVRRGRCSGSWARRKAKELLLLPRTVPAAGVPGPGPGHQGRVGAGLRGAVRELATTLAAGPTLAYGSIRRAVAFSAGVTALTESLAQRGRLHDPDRWHRRPPGGCGCLPRQGEAGLHRRVSVCRVSRRGSAQGV